MKWLIYAALLLGVSAGWVCFVKSGNSELRELEAEIERIQDHGTLEELERVSTLRDEIEQRKDGKSLAGLMFAFLTAAVIGTVFVIDLLPMIAHKLTHAVYDSGEEVEDDPLREARSKLAQGEYEDALAAFRDAAAADPLNRVPWVEIAKIQGEKLGDPEGAVATLREAIEGQEWQQNDAAFLMFRLAEIYDQSLGDRPAAVHIMRQVIDELPETRHSANARHKLAEWGAQGGESGEQNEEVG